MVRGGRECGLVPLTGAAEALSGQQAQAAVSPGREDRAAGRCSPPPGSSPPAQEVLIAEESDSVDREGAGGVEGEPAEEDAQALLPEADHGAVQEAPVGPLLQSVHLHPGLDHVERRGRHPRGQAREAPGHQHGGRAWGGEAGAWSGLEHPNLHPPPLPPSACPTSRLLPQPTPDLLPLTQAPSPNPPQAPFP